MTVLSAIKHSHKLWLIVVLLGTAMLSSHAIAQDMPAENNLQENEYSDYEGVNTEASPEDEYTESEYPETEYGNASENMVNQNQDVQQTEAEVIDLIEPAEDVPQPESAPLNNVDASNEDTDASISQNTASSNPTSINNADIFYDADAIGGGASGPSGQMATKSSPVLMSPETSGVSKLVIVSKDEGPDGNKAMLTSAQRAMALGRYDSALEIYSRILEKNENDVNALLGSAVAYQRLGQNEFAVQAYEQVLAQKPENLEAQLNMQGIIGQKFPAVALKNLMDILNQYPQNAGVAAQIAVLQAGLGKHEEALRYLGIAASLEPHNPLHIFNMAVIADQAGAKKEAVKFYEQALETDTLYGNNGSIPRDAIFVRLANLR